MHLDTGESSAELEDELGRIVIVGCSISQSVNTLRYVKQYETVRKINMSS